MMVSSPSRVLIIRFSSIGDIVLSSPVVRSLKAKWPACEVHFLTKKAFEPLVTHNPYIDVCHFHEEEAGIPWESLKAQAFDAILDLHANVRSWQVKTRLRAPSSTVDKRNWDKYRMVRFGTSLELPHIVHRYGETLHLVDASLDDKGLDCFIPPEVAKDADSLFANHFDGKVPQPVLAVVLGATYFTKRWPVEHFLASLQELAVPVLLLGGKDALEEGQYLEKSLPQPVWNAVGKYPLLLSAALMRKCQAVLTHDTGLMHIAAAFNQPIFSLWGNTVPAFGMTPYRSPHHLLEVEDLSCRPCSKIGFDRCPRGHFKCMQDLAPAEVTAALRTHLFSKN
ncbi:MAG: glycosyltransferase family 9 protein [Bacteroidota bacterium]